MHMCFLCGPCLGVINTTNLRVWLVMRQSLDNKDVNTEVEEATALEAVTK
jgi:hypothetical protein